MRTYALLAVQAAVLGVAADDPNTVGYGYFLEPKMNFNGTLRNEIDPVKAQPFVYDIQGPMLVQWFTTLLCPYVFFELHYGKDWTKFDKTFPTDSKIPGFDPTFPVTNFPPDGTRPQSGAIFWSKEQITSSTETFDPMYWWGLTLHCTNGQGQMNGPHFLLQGDKTGTGPSELATTVITSIVTRLAAPTRSMQFVTDGTTGPVPTGRVSTCSSGQTGCTTTTDKPSGGFFEAVLISTTSYQQSMTGPGVLEFGGATVSWVSDDFKDGASVVTKTFPVTTTLTTVTDSTPTEPAAQPATVTSTLTLTTQVTQVNVVTTDGKTETITTTVPSTSIAVTTLTTMVTQPAVFTRTLTTESIQTTVVTSGDETITSTITAPCTLTTLVTRITTGPALSWSSIDKSAYESLQSALSTTKPA